ncbi:twin-arginine translocase TatA/TatE family subunit [Sphingomonas sp. Sphisp140]|uniref:Sec-independent protein translocase protein TatA n=1 Tax=Sphingomonas kyeonggiensis TaxID=1268553 RepID=A0A7W6JX71_9SPHN|nr:twin-arginine translocase TatA/TatE family subunit [Sphingomonas kyeonggiensis]MBB4101223.1 sec-independent protein translocase protein TatA [Sphingomonas kyeonggiensis]
MGSFSLMHWLLLGVVAILLLGGGRFSNMMGDVAKGIKQFKKGMSEDDEAEKPATRIEGKAAPEPTVQREAEPAREEKL